MNLNFMVMASRFIFSVLVLCNGLLFFSCADDDERPAAESPVNEEQPAIPSIPSIPSNPVLAPSLSPQREAVLTDYRNYLATAVSNNGWTGDVSTCDAGDVPMLVREQAMKRWDYYRRQVGFSRALVLDESLSREAQETVLIMQANNILTHSLTEEIGPKCYTSKAVEYARRFNLGADRNGPLPLSEAIDDFVADFGVGNELVGHRAWLLHPKVHHVLLAATDSAVVVGWGWQIDDVLEDPLDPAIADGLIFASWPPAGFVVADLVYDRWSLHYFSKVDDEDIEQAEIAMVRKDTSEDIALRVIARYNRGISGLRTIVWEPNIEKPIDENDITYRVLLHGFMVTKEEKKIAYEVTMVASDVP